MDIDFGLNCDAQSLAMAAVSDKSAHGSVLPETAAIARD